MGNRSAHVAPCRVDRVPLAIYQHLVPCMQPEFSVIVIDEAAHFAGRNAGGSCQRIEQEGMFGALPLSFLQDLSHTHTVAGKVINDIPIHMIQ